MDTALDRVIDKYYGIFSSSSIYNNSHKFSIEFLKRHNSDINWFLASKSSNITLNDIINNPTLPWRYDGISCRIDLPMSYIQQNANKLNWAELSKYHNIQEIFEYPDLPWNYTKISNRVSWDEVLEHSELPWDYHSMTNNPNITADIIISNPELNWSYNDMCKKLPLDHLDKNKINYNMLSQNPHITIDYIYENRDQEWNYEILSSNESLSFEDIHKYPDLPWNMSALCVRFIDRLIEKLPAYCLDSGEMAGLASLDTIQKYPNKPWNYGLMSSNPNLTIDYIRQNINKNWNWSQLSHIFTAKELIENLDLPWDWSNILYMNIDWELIEANLSKIKFY